MKGITPFGIYTCKPEESRAFYRSTLGIERVWNMPISMAGNAGHAPHDSHVQPEPADEKNNPDGGVVLRLESPRLELFASEVHLLDRRVNDRIRGQYQLVMYPGDLTAAARNLKDAGVEFRTDYAGRIYFEDLNGIQWEMREMREGVVLM